MRKDPDHPSLMEWMIYLDLQDVIWNAVRRWGASPQEIQKALNAIKADVPHIIRMEKRSR
jgi:hypothetical protein